MYVLSFSITTRSKFGNTNDCVVDIMCLVKVLLAHVTYKGVVTFEFRSLSLAEAWVSHFESLGKLDDNFKNRAFQLHHQVQELERQPVFNHLDNVIKVEEIYKAISKLKNKKAVGLDSISNEMLKAAQTSLGHLIRLFMTVSGSNFLN